MARPVPLTPRDYYERHFPYEALEKLATSRGDPLCHREFAIEGDYYKRYLEERVHTGLRRACLEMRSLRSIHIGAVYTNGPSLARKGQAVPVRREVIIDIDLTDYDFFDLKTRDGEGNEIVDLEACDAAWPFAAIGIFLLRYMLREQFGYEHFLVVYSGRRGAHLWVLDERAMGASDEVRAAVAGFVNLELSKGFKRATSKMLAFVKTYELWDVVEHAFVELVVEGPYFDNYGNIESFVDRLELNHDGARSLGEDACNADSPSESWACIRRVVASIAKQPKQEWVAERLQETMLAYVWPRIDLNVTKATNHLIKCPYVAHPKTGRIAVPVDPNDYWRFDPRTAPSLADLGDDWAERTDVARWITRDPPTLPDPGRPRFRRARRSPPHATASGPDMAMDVEDLAGPAAAPEPRAPGAPGAPGAPRAPRAPRAARTSRAVPRPRRDKFVRRVSPLAPGAPEDARASAAMVTSDSE